MFELQFSPQNGLDALSSGLPPVAAGTVPVFLEEGTPEGGELEFEVMIEACHDPSDAQFSTWPLIQPNTGYIAVLAVANSFGVLNIEFEGTTVFSLDQ